MKEEAVHGTCGCEEDAARARLVTDVARWLRQRSREKRDATAFRQDARQVAICAALDLAAEDLESGAWEGQ